MAQTPLPSHIHYELLLKLLERQTLGAVANKPIIRDRVQQLIVTLRKALAQQREIETICEQAKLDYEYRWSLNDVELESNLAPTLLAQPSVEEFSDLGELKKSPKTLELERNLL